MYCFRLTSGGQYVQYYFSVLEASYFGAVKMLQVFVDATISLLDRMRCVSEWRVWCDRGRCLIGVRMG